MTVTVDEMNTDVVHTKSASKEPSAKPATVTPGNAAMPQTKIDEHERGQRRLKMRCARIRAH